MNRAPIVVVGASVAGVRVIELLRFRGYDGGLVLVDREPGLPYDKPALSKQVLTGELDEPPVLLTESALADLAVDHRPGIAATAVDVGARRLDLSDGSRLEWSKLVVATGATARRLPALAEGDGVHYLRTRDDAARLRAALVGRPEVVVVGGGFIGCEVAAGARRLGLQVTIVETGPSLVGRAMPRVVGEHLVKMHRDHGVDVRTGSSVVSTRGSARVEAVVLDDGSTVAADVVVVGVGVVPATAWLTGSNLYLEDGILCTERLAAVGTDDVFAVGDVARWHNPRYGCLDRVEHWTSAREQAAVVVDNLIGSQDSRCTLVPYVWSDQFGRLIQHVGRVTADARTESRPTRDGQGALFLHEDDRGGTAVTAVGAPADFLRERRRLGAAPFEQLTSRVPGDAVTTGAEP